MQLPPLVDPSLDPLADEAGQATENAAAASPGYAIDLSTPDGVAKARTPNPAFASGGGGPIVDAESLQVPSAAGQVEVRVIRPRGTPRGVYLFAHGGGLYTGRAAMVDQAAADLADELDICTVSIEYRLAPEHPHPAAEDDCVAVAEWLLVRSEEAFGTDRLLIGGGSVGATLAVRTLLRLGPEARRFRGANLLYGLYDFSFTPSALGEDLSYFDASFPGIRPEKRGTPGISPLYADLSGLPAALFTVGTADFLYDDSLFMAMRWRAAGNPAELEVYPEAGHGFDGFSTEVAREARRRVRRWMGERLK